MATSEKMRNGVGWKQFGGDGELMPVIRLSDHMDAWVLIEEKQYADPKKYPIITYLEEKKYAPLELEDPIFDKVDKYSLFKFRGTPAASMKTCFVGYFCDKDANGKEFCIISLPKTTDQTILSKKETDKEANDVLSYHAAFELMIKFLYRYRRELVKKDSLFNYATVDPANDLMLANRLGELYLKNGPYTVAESEINYRSGVPLWGQTVSRILPDVIVDEADATVSLHYPKLIKKRSRCLETEITEIQKAALKHLFCDKHYSSILLLQPRVENSAYSYEDLKNNPFILGRLKEEQLRTFDDDDREMLEILILLLSDQPHQESRKIYAITKYERLFEMMLGEYWGNQVSISYRMEQKENLADVTFRSECPDIGIVQDINCDALNPIKWNVCGAETKRRNNYNIFIPDIVLDFQEQAHCVIVDAKYYDVKLPENTVSGSLFDHPGKDDVLKQLHYEEIFRYIYAKKQLQPTLSNIFAVPLTKEMAEYMRPSLEANATTEDILIPVGMVNVEYTPEAKKIRVIAVRMGRVMSELLSGESNVKKNREALLKLLNHE